MRRTFVLAVLVGACTAEPPATNPPKDALALAYVPSEHPTGRRIAAIQAELRTAPSVQGHLTLARWFIRRRRETSAPVLMTYAESAIAAALEQAPRDPRGLLLSGLVHQYGHRFERAAATAHAVLRHADPHAAGLQADAYLLLGDARLEVGAYDEAVAAYQAAMDRRPDVRAYNRAAYVTWLHGQGDEALSLLATAMDATSARDPEASAWCWVDVGQIHRLRGDAIRAVAAADRALNLVPAYVPALTLRARARRDAADLAGALEDYRAVLSRLPTVETLVEVAELLQAQGSAAQAERRRSQARALAADDPRPWAHDLARRGVEPQAALRAAERALSNRKSIFAWDTYGLALARVGRFDEAAAALDRALALGTRWAEPHLHRAVVAIGRGDRAAARKALAEAERIDPRVDPALVRQVRGAL